MEKNDFLLRAIPLINKEIESLKRTKGRVAEDEIKAFVNQGEDLIELFKNRSKAKKHIPSVIRDWKDFSVVIMEVHEEAKMDDEVFAQLSDWVDKIYVTKGKSLTS